MSRRGVRDGHVSHSPVPVVVLLLLFAVVVVTSHCRETHVTGVGQCHPHPITVSLAASLCPRSTRSTPMLLCQSDVAPTFFLHPTSQTVALGDHLHLVVDAGGLPPPQFQWMHDGAALPGQTSAELYIPTFLPDTAGAYTCRAFNDVGSAVSNAAEVRGTSP